MSISYFVYSTAEPIVKRSNLGDHLQSKSWSVLFADADAVDVTHVLPDGPIKYDLLLASRSAETMEKVKALIASKDKDALDELYERNRVASCTAAIQPFEFDERYGEADLDELAAAIGKEVMEEMRHATIQYEIYSSASRSAPTYEFQQAVWDGLGELSGGLMEDPQCGMLYRWQHGEKQEISTPAEPDSDLPDTIAQTARFIEEAGRRGFPVKGKGGNAGVVTDDLDLNRMEQLLELASQYQVRECPCLIQQMLLDEYVASKDESFEAEHGEWIAAMKRRYISGESPFGTLWRVIRTAWTRLFG